MHTDGGKSAFTPGARYANTFGPGRLPARLWSQPPPVRRDLDNRAPTRRWARDLRFRAGPIRLCANGCAAPFIRGETARRQAAHNGGPAGRVGAYRFGLSRSW